MKRVKQYDQFDNYITVHITHHHKSGVKLYNNQKLKSKK